MLLALTKVTNPATGGESMPKSKTRAAEKDATTLLKGDHKKIHVLLGELEETSTRAVDKREELLQTIERELKIHAKIEEQIFYPAFREAAEKQDAEGVLTKLVELVRPS
jgi:hemerythrin superfamily protein